ncbi:hypothetical protein BDQ17DRAFT_1337447 [Cyathus striatus]|nr:hypothetical protein BDQ17DRAFT_1337447 [Cyathus striatus]
MDQHKKKLAEKLSHAQSVKAEKVTTKRLNTSCAPIPNNTQANVDECAWDGTVNHWASENNSDDSDYWESEDSTSSSGSETDSEDEFFKLEGEELVKSLERQVQHEVEELERCRVTGYEAIQCKISKKEWKIAEQS